MEEENRKFSHKKGVRKEVGSRVGVSWSGPLDGLQIRERLKL